MLYDRTKQIPVSPILIREFVPRISLMSMRVSIRDINDPCHYCLMFRGTTVSTIQTYNNLSISRTSVRSCSLVCFYDVCLYVCPDACMFNLIFINIITTKKIRIFIKNILELQN